MHPSLQRSWIVWSCAALFFCYQFMLRVSPSVMTHELMADFLVDACALGTLTSFYFYAYAGLQLPVGVLLDRFGPRHLLIFAALLCSGGSLLFALSDTVLVASIARFLIGAGSAFGFLSCMKLGALWFPPQKISMVVGFTLFLGTLGAMSGSYPMSFLVDGFGWRQAVEVTAVGGILLAFLIALFVRNRPPKEMEAYIEQHHAFGNPPLNILEGAQIVLKKGQTWLLAFYGTMMYVPLSGFADMWGVPFLTHVHHMDKSSAALSTSLLYLGVGIGTPLFAFFSDFFQKFKLSLLGSAIGALIPFAIIIYGPALPPSLVIALLFLAGIMLGGQFMAFAIISEINPLSVSGMATGVQNMVNLSSGIIFQPFIGWILVALWEEAYVDGVPVYSSAIYQMALTTVVVALLLATFTSLFIREAYPERK